MSDNVLAQTVITMMVDVQKMMLSCNYIKLIPKMMIELVIKRIIKTKLFPFYFLS